jgi:LmbE family N-acetylglucosaminyl deacetylase
MTSQHLAHIRKAEEEAAEAPLGTLKENLLWMGYDDGMLEYAPQPKLVEEATAIIRRIRPDVLLSIDPGEWYERWHKTDHRMAAFNTIDAVRAAEFWLYFPNQRLQQHLEPYTVPVILLLSSAAGSQLLRQHRQCGRSQARSGDETRQPV